MRVQPPVFVMLLLRLHIKKGVIFAGFPLIARLCCPLPNMFIFKSRRGDCSDPRPSFPSMAGDALGVLDESARFEADGEEGRQGPSDRSSASKLGCPTPFHGPLGQDRHRPLPSDLVPALPRGMSGVHCHPPRCCLSRLVPVPRGRQIFHRFQYRIVESRVPISSACSVVGGMG